MAWEVVHVRAARVHIVHTASKPSNAVADTAFRRQRWQRTIWQGVSAIEIRVQENVGVTRTA